MIWILKDLNVVSIQHDHLPVDSERRTIDRFYGSDIQTAIFKLINEQTSFRKRICHRTRSARSDR
jgi:hypothetical protein